MAETSLFPMSLPFVSSKAYCCGSGKVSAMELGIIPPVARTRSGGKWEWAGARWPATMACVQEGAPLGP